MPGRFLSLALLLSALAPATANAGFILSISPSDTGDVGNSHVRDVIATWDNVGASMLAIQDQGLSVTTDSPFIDSLVLNLDTSLTVYDAVGGVSIGTISFDALTGTTSDTEEFEINVVGIEIVGALNSPLDFTQSLSVTAIPEPTSAALLSLALLGVTRIRRRKS